MRDAYSPPRHRLNFQITRQEVGLQHDTVLQGLMPAHGLALGLGVIGCAANMVHALLGEPVGEITGDVTRSIVAAHRLVPIADREARTGGPRTRRL